MTYALLIYTRESERDPIPANAEAAALAEHRALQADAAAAGQLLSVARLQSKGRAKTVRRDGAQHIITDGPYLETKEWFVGLYMVDCESEEQALAYARRLVTSDHHCIEVRPVRWHRHE